MKTHFSDCSRDRANLWARALGQCRVCTELPRRADPRCPAGADWGGSAHGRQGEALRPLLPHERTTPEPAALQAVPPPPRLFRLTARCGHCAARAGRSDAARVSSSHEDRRCSESLRHGCAETGWGGRGWPWLAAAAVILRVKLVNQLGPAHPVWSLHSVPCAGRFLLEHYLVWF